MAALALPAEVRARALNLLERIQQAHTAEELFRASDRAEGFVMGVETVKALNPASIEALYVLFDNAATARRQEHEQ
ncbi:hypothetical protein J3P97_06555 [Pseudomonas sp. R1-15]